MAPMMYITYYGHVPIILLYHTRWRLLLQAAAEGAEQGKIGAFVTVTLCTPFKSKGKTNSAKLTTMAREGRRWDESGMGRIRISWVDGRQQHQRWTVRRWASWFSDKGRCGPGFKLGHEVLKVGRISRSSFVHFYFSTHSQCTEDYQEAMEALIAPRDNYFGLVIVSNFSVFLWVILLQVTKNIISGDEGRHRATHHQMRFLSCGDGTQ